MMNSDLLKQFPKTRPQLPREFSDIYAEIYKANRSGDTNATKLSSRMEQWMHRQVAKDVASKKMQGTKTLEVGAGTLNHLKYYSDIQNYDVIEPMHSLYENSEERQKVHDFYDDITEIKDQNCYDRIVSIATFEHILNLPEVVAHCARLMKTDGNMRIAIPSEGGLLWYLGWKLTTGVEFRLKYNLDYSILMRHEHVNSWREIKSLLSLFFDIEQEHCFGLSKDLSFYQFYACKNPKKDLAESYLKGGL